MIKIIFTQGKRKQVQTTKTKKARIKGIKKDFKGSVNFYQTRNYKFFLFTFFIWYNNFKNCSKNLSFQINIFLRLITVSSLSSTSKDLKKNLKLHDFYGRLINYKILFSVAFLKFPFEKYPSIKKNLEFIFLKKKSKF